MKKIAIPVSKGCLSPHFGHCEIFYIYEVENNKILNEIFLSSPPHEPGLFPKWLRENGVTDIIAGGMGHRAINLFHHYNINVFVGAPQKEPKQILNEFLKGTLILSENYCDH